ncbi:hypothetical protein WA026_014793 [Henosepilachna vigintioctopunctata]|uniref:Ecdysteroid UDP-glucosyltransferase n=1 Tax=Henosepilachna vigintioctopunctata TaxID=420089 RepID=A0AAW1V161_9CUCU
MTQFGRFFVNILIAFCLCKSTFSARIFASVSTAAYSHQVAFRPIWKELANRGHEIVLMTTDPMEETKNIRQIDMSFSYTIMKERNFSSIVTNDLQNGSLNSAKLLSDIFFDYIFKQIEHPEVQQIINNKSEHFDLLMLELMFPIHLGLLEKLKLQL